MRTIVISVCLLLSSVLLAAEEKPKHQSCDYDVARTHELKPHRRSIPLEGVNAGFNQFHLALTVSPVGDVVDAEANPNESIMQFWPRVREEVLRWKFTPFEENGKAVTAEVEEYLDLVPPERLPKQHVTPPIVRQKSKIAITLLRSGCYGTCPSYTLTISTEGITFEGHGYVVASGRHLEKVDAAEVRKLARRFVAADFYSMESRYVASVTDNPTYQLSIVIDGRTKEVTDYVGQWEGMPAVIVELEDAVDTLAGTERWISGSRGLVETLRAERFNFQALNAQTMLKEAASRGATETVQEFLDAGVPLEPIDEKVKEDKFSYVKSSGWLTAASRHPETLEALIKAEASKGDQHDKNVALTGAARSGSIEAVRMLIAYGADPNADLSRGPVPEPGGGMKMQGAGSILIYAAESGNPEMVREILAYHPKLEMRDWEGKTALFAAGEYGYRDKDGARAECVRLLVEAGADVNARDNHGNTPLHETFLSEVEEELLKLGADVNARNDDGETPIFTTVDHTALSLFITHGADLTIRNNKGETVVEAAKEKGPAREEALRKAMEEARLH